MQPKTTLTFARAATVVAGVALMLSPAAVSAQAEQPSAGPGADQAYFEFQVEKPAMAHQGNPRPLYPVALQRNGVNGQVLAQFVVDTTGRVDASTFQVVKASDKAFVSAVRQVLPGMRFFPAEEGGRKVRQLVQQSFVFVASR